MLPHVTVGALFRYVRRMLGAVLLVLAVLAGIGGAVVAQAGREEAAEADTALLMLDGTEQAQADRLDRAVRLYLGGQISRIVLAGSDPAPARDLLVARGVVQDKIAMVAETTQLDQLRAVPPLFQETRVADAMLIAEPVESLRLLKISRDLGLGLRSAPTSSDSSINLGAVVDEVGRYLAYSFVGR